MGKRGQYRLSATNVVRHACARQVEVTLDRAGGRLRLCVRDAGRGLPDEGPGRAGTGLDSMRRRASAIGATMSIATGDERGGVRAELIVR